MFAAGIRRGGKGKTGKRKEGIMTHNKEERDLTVVTNQNGEKDREGQKR